MSTQRTELDRWVKDEPEDLHLEFKGASGTFSEPKIFRYCAALANEKGGKLILGVSDGRPRRVVGTAVYTGTHQTLSHKILIAIGARVDVEEYLHPDGRVLIFHVASRLPGVPVKVEGQYLMRAGESLVQMNEATLKNIFSETAPDFTSLPVPGLTLGDLDGAAMAKLQTLWARKANRKDYLRKTPEQMLRDLCLLEAGHLNYAALILLGKPESISRLLPDDEIIFEWRRKPEAIPHDFRESWRGPFLKVYDAVWAAIDSRNSRFPLQEGFVQREIKAFNEKSVREAVLNAVAHRDYQITGRSVSIKASSVSFVVESPGGFLPGITPENALVETAWRNRRLAETLEKAGLVERSGQGLDDIFERSIRDGKGAPDFSGSTPYAVKLTIPAQVKDKEFILFLEKVAKEKRTGFPVGEILELERIRQGQTILNPEYEKRFIDLGIIEKIGRGKGRKYILSHRYYIYADKVGHHTKLVGLTREAKKALIISHLKKNKKGFAHDFVDAFQEIKPKDVYNLLQELRSEGKIQFIGTGPSGHWVIAKRKARAKKKS